jgi:hypothetical protein
MVELVVEELRPEMEAYEDFCRFRTEETARRNSDKKSGRAADANGPSRARTGSTRSAPSCMARMRERGGLRGLFSLFGSSET